MRPNIVIDRLHASLGFGGVQARPVQNFRAPDLSEFYEKLTLFPVFLPFTQNIFREPKPGNS